MITSYSELDLRGRLLFCTPNSAFPKEPKLGMVITNDNVVYAYLLLNNNPQWIPLTDKLESYSRIQTIEDLSWNVIHNLNSENLLVIVYDLDGVPQENGFTVVNLTTNTLRIDFQRRFRGSVTVFKLKSLSNLDEMTVNMSHLTTARVSNDLFLRNPCSLEDFSLRKMFRILGSMSKKLAVVTGSIIIKEETAAWLRKFFQENLFIESGSTYNLNNNYLLLISNATDNIVSSLLETVSKDELRQIIYTYLITRLTNSVLLSFRNRLRSYYNLLNNTEMNPFVTDLLVGDMEHVDLLVANFNSTYNVDYSLSNTEFENLVFQVASEIPNLSTRVKFVNRLLNRPEILLDLQQGFAVGSPSDETIIDLNYQSIADVFREIIEELSTQIHTYQLGFVERYKNEIDGLFYCEQNLIQD